MTSRKMATIHASPSSTALLFVGQGAQTVGMTKDQLEIPKVQEMYDIAKDVLGYDLKQIVLEGPPEKLSQTEHAQPALLIAGLAAVEKLRIDDPHALDQVSVVAGLSLGEYTALVHSGALTFEEAIKLVGIRARAMQSASDATNGTMMSVIGVKDEALGDLCARASKETGEVVKIANYLFPKGRVLAGTSKAIDQFKRNLDSSSEKPLKVTKLEVSGAFHSSLMLTAQTSLENALQEVEIKSPTIPVIANTTSRPYASVEEIKKELAKQVVEPVQWENSIKTIIDNGVSILYDMGPRATIKAMIRKIDMKVAKKSVSIDV